MSPLDAGLLLGFVVGFCSGFIACGFVGVFKLLREKPPVELEKKR